MLTFLTVNAEHKCRRETLANLLWSGPGRDERSRASLRQCVSALRKSLDKAEPGLIGGAGDEIRFARGRIQTDLEVLLNQLPLDPEQNEIEDLPDRLKFAFSEFDGLSDLFDNWISETRERLSRRLLEALRQALNDGRRPADVRRTLARVTRRIDSFAEDALRAEMSAEYELGNAAAGLRLYDAFCAQLEEEMDAEPSLETQELAVSIKLATDDGRPEKQSRTVFSRPVTTVAVLPFSLIGPDRPPNFVALGILDQLTCHLARYRAPAVISSNTTRQYLGKSPRPAEIGQDLSAAYVVSGSVFMEGSRATVSIQVSDTACERLVWGNTQICNTTDVLGLQAELSEEIARAIMPSINVAELQRSETLAATELEPFHMVLRAKELIFRLDRSDFAAAGQILQQAVNSSPYFAPAHTLLSEWFAINIWEGWSNQPSEDRRSLENHVRRAISLSPGDGRAMALWGHSRFMFEHEHDAAIRLFQDAVKLCPNDAETLIWSVPGLAHGGEPAAAVENGTRAIQLSPLDPFLFRNEHFLSVAQYADGNFDAAADLGLSSFRRAPDYSSNLRATIAALSAAGRLDEAGPLVAHHHELEPGFSVDSFIPRHGSRNQTDRELYGGHLIRAGLPR